MLSGKVGFLDVPVWVMSVTYFSDLPDTGTISHQSQASGVTLSLPHFPLQCGKTETIKSGTYAVWGTSRELRGSSKPLPSPAASF